MMGHLRWAGLVAACTACSLAFPTESFVLQPSPCVPAPCAQGMCGVIPNTCDGTQTIRCGDGCDYLPDGGVAAGTRTCNALNQCAAVPTSCTRLSQAEACVAKGLATACHLRDDGCGGVVQCGGCRQQEQCKPGSSGLRFCVCVPRTLASCSETECGQVLPDQCGGLFECPKCP